MAPTAFAFARGDSGIPCGDRRRPVLAFALAVAAAAALGATGPSLAYRAASDVTAPRAPISKESIDGRSHQGRAAPADFGQTDADDYVPQVNRIIRFPADDL